MKTLNTKPYDTNERAAIIQSDSSNDRKKDVLDFSSGTPKRETIIRITDQFRLVTRRAVLPEGTELHKAEVSLHKIPLPYTACAAACTFTHLFQRWLRLPWIYISVDRRDFWSRRSKTFKQK